MTSITTIIAHSASVTVMVALPPFEFRSAREPAVAGFVYKLE
jgi:hypothetical protein